MVYLKVCSFPAFAGGTMEKHGTTPSEWPMGLKFTQLPTVCHTEDF
jgi:hypothetical protein